MAKLDTEEREILEAFEKSRNTLQLPPTNKRAYASLHGLIPPKDNITLLFIFARKLIPEFQVIKIAIGNCFTGFNFDRYNIFSIY